MGPVDDLDVGEFWTVEEGGTEEEDSVYSGPIGQGLYT